MPSQSLLSNVTTRCSTEVPERWVELMERQTFWLNLTTILLSHLCHFTTKLCQNFLRKIPNFFLHSAVFEVHFNRGTTVHFRASIINWHLTSSTVSLTSFYYWGVAVDKCIYQKRLEINIRDCVLMHSVKQRIIVVNRRSSIIQTLKVLHCPAPYQSINQSLKHLMCLIYHIKLKTTNKGKKQKKEPKPY